MTNAWLDIDSVFNFSAKLQSFLFLYSQDVTFDIEDNNISFYRFWTPLIYFQDVHFPDNGKGSGSNQLWDLTFQSKEVKWARRDTAILIKGDGNLLLKGTKYQCISLLGILFYYLRHFITTGSVIKMGKTTCRQVSYGDTLCIFLFLPLGIEIPNGARNI